MAVFCCPFLFGIDQNEEDSQEIKRFYGFSIGGGASTLTVASTSNTAFAPTLGLKICHLRRKSYSTYLDVDFQLLPVENLLREEQVQTLFMLYSSRYQKKNQGDYLEGGAGMSINFWSGPDPWKPVEAGPALGGIFGYIFPTEKDFNIGIEGYFRSNVIISGDQVLTIFIGVRAVFTWGKD